MSKQKAHQKLNQLTAVLMMAAAAALAAPAVQAGAGPSGPGYTYEVPGQLGAVAVNPYKIAPLTVVMEDKLSTPITFSALIAIMFIGIGLQKKRETVAKRLSVKYGKLWVAAEVFLFVLVGATVNIGYLGKVGVKALIVIIGALVFRMFGVFVCLLGTSLKRKERLFTMLAYTPKATVQAAIGGIPLALGFTCGDLVLTVAVLAIVLTAPLGAFAIDLSYKKLLNR